MLEAAMPETKYRGRRKGIPVREGSVLQARKEAHLTLAQVAGDKVSRTAVHLIEKGRTQPSLETLQQIARQTRKPIEYFLLAPDDSTELSERRRQVRELERLTQVRDFEKVIEIALTLLEMKWSDEDTALVHFYLGQAYCRLVRPHEALVHLPQAQAAFESLGDQWMAVDALDWRASALGLMEDKRALPLAHEALERCRRLDPKPAQTEVRILGHIASMFVVAHAWSEAIRYYEAAADAANGVKDLLQLAKMHHGLGVAYQRIRQPARARQEFDKALALYSIEADLSAVYRVENDLGDLLLNQGHLDSAEQHFHKALAGLDELRIDRRGRGFVLASLGEVNLRRGRLTEAIVYLEQAWEAGEATGERVILADVHPLLAEIKERQDNPQGADTHFELAIRILEELDMPDRLRDCQMKYAEVLNARGDIIAAARHWKSAAEAGRLASPGFSWSHDTSDASDDEAVAASGEGPAA